MRLAELTIEQVRTDADGISSIRSSAIAPPNRLTIRPLTLLGSHHLTPHYSRPTSERYIAEVDDGLIWAGQCCRCEGKEMQALSI